MTAKQMTTVATAPQLQWQCQQYAAVATTTDSGDDVDNNDDDKEVRVTTT